MLKTPQNLNAKIKKFFAGNRLWLLVVFILLVTALIANPENHLKDAATGPAREESQAEAGKSDNKSEAESANKAAETAERSGKLSADTDTESIVWPTLLPRIGAQEPPQAESGKIPSELHKVIRVIDGDTVSVDFNGVAEAVRVIGIDTPETVDSRKPVECFGLEASAKAKELLDGKSVSLESDFLSGDRDIYSRLLRDVFLENGENFGEMMIEQGYAHEYTYNDIPHKHQKEFQAAENYARENKLGLWADGACAGGPAKEPPLRRPR